MHKEIVICFCVIPKVDWELILISWWTDPYLTRTWMTCGTLELSSVRLCTTIPPGRSSHSPSPASVVPIVIFIIFVIRSEIPKWRLLHKQKKILEREKEKRNSEMMMRWTRSRRRETNTKERRRNVKKIIKIYFGQINKEISGQKGSKYTLRFNNLIFYASGQELVEEKTYKKS